MTFKMAHQYDFAEVEDAPSTPTDSPPTNEGTDDCVNRCLICGVDMGDCNPRQLCGKVYCYSQL